MIKRSALLFSLGWIAAMPAYAGDYFDPDYPGSEVVADGTGQVHVKAVFFPNDSCWRIASSREGVPDKEADQPTERHLYVTVNVAHGSGDCQPTSTPLETRLDVPDKKGKISLDIFFVDERGVLIRSQRHRIQRDSCAC